MNTALPLIAVDIGNSTMKLGLFDALPSQRLPQPSQVLETASRDAALATLLEKLPDAPRRWCVVSVQRQAEQTLAAWVRMHRPQDEYRLLTHRDLPLAIDLQQPERVGVDRLAAALAANRLRRAGQPGIVIDAGSAVTVDVLSPDGAFQGGAILPGVMMLARALAEEADLLPNLELTLEDQQPPPIGKSTEDAMRSGIFWGVVGSVRELIQRISGQFDATPQIFLSGGLGKRLTPFLDGQTECIPHLVLGGIAVTQQEQAGSSPIASEKEQP